MASSYGTRANRAAADAGNGGVAAGAIGGAGGAGVAAPLPQQQPFEGNGPYDLPPPFFNANAGEGGGIGGAGIGVQQGNAGAAGAGAVPNAPPVAAQHVPLQPQVPEVAHPGAVPMGGAPGPNDDMCFGQRGMEDMVEVKDTAKKGTLDFAIDTQLAFEGMDANARLLMDPVIAENLGGDRGEPFMPLANTLVAGLQSVSLGSVKTSVTRAGGGMQIVLMAVLVAAVGGRLLTLEAAQARRLKYTDHDRLAHHVFACTFDSFQNAIFQHVMIFGPKVCVWKVGELDNIQNVAKTVQGAPWVLPLSAFGNLRVAWAATAGSVRSTLETIAAGELPSLAASFVHKASVLNGKWDREMEGGRYHVSWSNPADATSNEDVIYWRWVFRAVTTEFFQDLLVNKMSAGPKDVPAFMARLKLLGSKSLQELQPHMTHLFGLGQSEVARFRISSRPAVQLLFFMGKWDRDDLSKISLADFLHEGVVFNWSKHTNDLCIGLQALDLYMCTHLGDHWRGVFASYALDISTQPVFKEFRPHIKTYAVHLILTLAFDDMTAEVGVFGWESIWTAVTVVRRRFDEGLRRDNLVRIRDTYDFDLSGKITFPHDCRAGEHVIAGSGDDRSAPKIAAAPAAAKVAKRRQTEEAKDLDLFADPSSGEEVVPKNPKKKIAAEPKDPARVSYCFASLIAGFDLTTLQGTGCSDPESKVKCRRGVHVEKSALPSVQAVLKAMSGFKAPIAQDIVKLLKEKL